MKINLRKIGNFLKARVKEKSTWVGVAAIAVAVGEPGIAQAVGKYSDIAMLILGGAAVSADTTNVDHLD